MPIDTRIALGVQPMQLQMPDPNSGMNSLAKVMQMRDMQANSEMNALKADEYKRGVATERAIGDAYKGAMGADGAIDQNRLLRDLAVGGHGAKIPALRKQFMEADTAAATLQKTKLDAQKIELETGIKKTEHVASMLSQANPANYGTVRAVVKSQYGLDLPEQFDPNFISTSIAQGQTLTQRLAAEHQRLTLAETTTHNRNSEGIQVRGQNMTASTAARGQDITVRGQNLTDARTRESTAATITKPFEITGEDGKPVLVQQDKQGNIRPVQGYGPKQGASKPLTDTQAKALQFGSRMQAAEGIFDTMAKAGTENPSRVKQALEATPLVGPALGAAANAVVASPNQQSVEQAQRDFVNAVLRRESGAAISPSEFESARRQYFPAVGDGPQVKAQKKANRELATRGILAEVPDSENRVAKVRAGAPASHIDSLLDKYK